MTRIYVVGPDVDDTSNGYAYFSTKAAAMELARRMAREGRNFVTVSVSTVRTDLRKGELFARLLNQLGWAEETETIFDSDPRSKAEGSA